MTWKYIPFILIVSIATFVIHEAGHFFAGKLLGYEMYVSINKAGPKSGTELAADWHRLLITMGGPFVTYLQALIGLWVANKYKALWAFPVVFMAFMMRLMAAGISLISPNDEHRASEALGIGAWTLPLLAVAALFVITLLTSKRLGLRWKSWAMLFLTTNAAITAIIFTERYWPIIRW